MRPGVLFTIEQAQARTQGGCTGCTCTPPPHLGKKFRSEMSKKEERKFRSDISEKRNVHVPLRYDKIKTKKVEKKEENSKMEGLKSKK